MIQIPEARWIIAGTILLFVVSISIYIAFFFRNLALGIGESEDSSELLSDFRQMRNEGQLNDLEFSRLKEVLPSNRTDETGLTENNGSQDVGAQKPGKKFLTLAEAQRRKQEGSGNDETGSVDGKDESE